MSVLSFNVTHTTDSQVVDAARDAVIILHRAGVMVGTHNKKALNGGISNVRIQFDASGALGPRVNRALDSIRALPLVDAVKTF